MRFLRLVVFGMALAGTASVTHAETRDGAATDAQGPGPAGLDERVPEIRTIAMPADTNPSGAIFGGWLMAQMDLAAGSVASRVARGRVATVAVDAMTFISPVEVGDEVSVYADLLDVGTTSMSIR